MKQTYIVPFFKDGVHMVGNRSVAVTVPEKESQIFNNQIFSELTLEVKGTAGSSAFPVVLSGCIDNEANQTFFNIAGINLTDFKPELTITEPGLYSFSVSGISHLKVALNATGSDLTVTGKFSE